MAAKNHKSETLDILEMLMRLGVKEIKVRIDLTPIIEYVEKSKPIEVEETESFIIEKYETPWGIIERARLKLK